MIPIVFDDPLFPKTNSLGARPLPDKGIAMASIDAGRVQRIRWRKQLNLRHGLSHAAWQQIKVLAHKMARMAQEQQATTSGALLGE
jgi:hypothetical protein